MEEGRKKEEEGKGERKRGREREGGREIGRVCVCLRKGEREKGHLHI
jgi:hypothetical protein